MQLEFIAEIADIDRFHDSFAPCSYAGLVPGIKQSGNRLKTGRLIKQANLSLKHTLVQAAWASVRMKEPNALNIYFRKLSKPKGKQKAICATARKLYCIMYAMLKKREEFKA